MVSISQRYGGEKSVYVYKLTVLDSKKCTKYEPRQHMVPDWFLFKQTSQKPHFTTTGKIRIWTRY